MVLGWGSKKAQTHHDDEDMSMEEILASIRKYVSEETTAKETDRFQDTAKVMDSPYRTEAEVRSPRRVVDDSDAEFAPSNSFETSSLFAEEDVTPKIEEFAVTKETLKTKPMMQDLHVESEPVFATSNPFAKLAEATKIKETPKPTATAATGVTLDQLVGDLARPMIQKWIDQNMATVVEKMVAQEIAKMTGQK